MQMHERVPSEEETRRRIVTEADEWVDVASMTPDQLTAMTHELRKCTHRIRLSMSQRRRSLDRRKAKR